MDMRLEARSRQRSRRVVGGVGRWIGGLLIAAAVLAAVSGAVVQGWRPPVVGWVVGNAAPSPVPGREGGSASLVAQTSTLPLWASARRVPRLVGPEGLCGSVVLRPGVVVTARHCLEPTQEVLLEVRAAPVTPVCVSQRTDIAILRDAEGSRSGWPMISTRIAIDTPPGDYWIVGWPKGQFRAVRTRLLGIVPFSFVRGVGFLPSLLVFQHPEVGLTGVSGGGVFTLRGELSGIVCCLTTTGEVLAVPIRDAVPDCKFR